MIDKRSETEKLSSQLNARRLNDAAVITGARTAFKVQLKVVATVKWVWGYCLLRSNTVKTT